MIRKRAALIFLVALVVFIFGGVILWIATAKNEPPYLKNAQPNGYEKVVSASRLLTVDDLPDPGTNTAELAEFVAKNRAAIDALRQALELNFEAPAEAYAFATAQTYYDSASRIKRLAQTLKYEGRLAEYQGRFSGAADIYLKVMSFGQKIQAGPMISFLWGLSIEGLGHQALNYLEPKVFGPDRARIAAELEKLNMTRLPFDQIVRRERYYTRRNTRTPLHYFFAVYKQRAVIARTRTKHDNFSKSVQELADKYKAKHRSSHI